MPKVLRAMSAQARPAADWAQVKLSLLPAATNFKTESAIAGGAAPHYFKSFHEIDLELDAPALLRPPFPSRNRFGEAPIRRTILIEIGAKHHDGLRGYETEYARATVPCTSLTSPSKGLPDIYWHLSRSCRRRSPLDRSPGDLRDGQDKGGHQPFRGGSR
jgi:hypothetical protein